MSSRISIARPQGSGYSPDPHGIGNSRPSSAGYRAADPENPVEQLRYYAKQIEDYVEIYSQPLRPYLPAIGRFLIIVTFLEDSLRIVTQWGDQLWYLQKYVSFIPRLETLSRISFHPLLDTGTFLEESLTFFLLSM
jgi:ER-derived vesicles protein